MSQPEPQPGQPLPKRPKAETPRGDQTDRDGDTDPQRGAPLPQRRPLPQRDDIGTNRGGSSSLPGGSIFDPLPGRGQPQPPGGNSVFDPRPPQHQEPLPQRQEPLPQRQESLPRQREAAPLPRRTTRSARAGRHRSPHRLSVALEAPALVIAVPGTAEDDSAGIGPAVAEIAALSCPGVDIRVGYVAGQTRALAQAIDDGTQAGDPGQFPSVIVPLLVSPDPDVDDIVRRTAELPALPAVVAAHLGAHPLVAEALHARLAEAGLARQARSSGLSISADGHGVDVLADVGAEAASEASVIAVLLASRLSTPVMPASLGDPASIAEAVSRLSDSGASRPALAPCLIGPGSSVAVLDDLGAALGAPCAAPLGAHQAIGQLVAVRYGAALATLSLAG